MREPNTPGARAGREPAQPLRLDYVDGLRALAALAVVVLHGFQVSGYGLGDLPISNHATITETLIGRVTGEIFENVVELFHYAVQVFIVLSGFSLMLPVVRRGDGTLSGGALQFFRRRARRILPPFYAAVVIALLVTALIPGMNTRSGVFWDLALPALEPQPILARLFMVHNLIGDPLAVNPPLWTIAVEWQIYFLFPLLVILWRRIGTLGTTLVALAYSAAMSLGYAATGLAFPFSHWWFVGLFALGMAAASISFSPRAAAPTPRRQLMWWGIAASAAALFLGLKLLGVGSDPSAASAWIEKPVLDTMLGLAVMGLLVALSMSRGTARRWAPVALASHPTLVWIGHFSYSLYLIHAPILAVLALAGRALGLPPEVAFPLHIIVGPILSIGLSYLFFQAFERPFMSGGAKRAVNPPRDVQPVGVQ